MFYLFIYNFDYIWFMNSLTFHFWKVKGLLIMDQNYICTWLFIKLFRRFRKNFLLVKLVVKIIFFFLLKFDNTRIFYFFLFFKIRCRLVSTNRLRRFFFLLDFTKFRWTTFIYFNFLKDFKLSLSVIKLLWFVLHFISF